MHTGARHPADVLQRRLAQDVEFGPQLPQHFLVSDPVLLGVIVLLSAMPVATNGTMLCYQYGGDSKTMAQGTFVTTLGAVFTIPLLAVLFMA